MDTLVLHSSTSGVQVASKEIIRYINETIKTTVLTEALDDSSGPCGIYALTNALTAESYDKAFILCANTSTGAAGVMSNKSYTNIWGKLLKSTAKGTLITSGMVVVPSPDTNSTTVVVLAAADRQAEDYYNGMILSITAGTNATKYSRILNYVASTNTVTLAATADTYLPLTAACDATSGYSIFDASDVIAELGNTDALNNNVLYQTWVNQKPGCDIPKFVQLGGQYNFIEHRGASAGITASSITLDAANTAGCSATAAQIATDNFFKDKYVYIIPGSNGAGQMRKILSYVGSSRVATVAAWDATLPTSASAFYAIVSDEHFLFGNEAVEAQSLTRLKNAGAYATAAIQKLIDKDQTLRGLTRGMASQDFDYFYNEFLFAGVEIVRHTNIANILTDTY